MKNRIGTGLLGLAMIVCAGQAAATNVNGRVVCDVNVNQEIDADDTGLAGVKFTVTGVGMSQTFNESGSYLIALPAGVIASYELILDETTLPVDGTLLTPNPQIFETTSEDLTPTVDWLVDAPSCRGPFCGDGTLDPNEACDDGNNVDGDGCSAQCTVEAFCGDGELDPGEQCDDGNNVNGDGCSAVCTFEGGGEGCTPGYWRQDQHFDSYPAPYTSATLFADAFGVDGFPGLSLSEVAALGKGGLNALGRHAVAALLNAASPDVSYDRSVDMVIDAFAATYMSSKDDIEALKNMFEAFNEQSCPLN